MKRKPLAAADEKAAKDLHDDDTDDARDGCDVEFGAAEQTSDEDLPASTGGIE